MKTILLVVFLIFSFALSAERFVVTGADGDKVVKDSVTNLVWQQTLLVEVKMWQEAIDYCEGLDYGTYQDWRLPNRNELMSIVDYSESSPAVNTAVFTGVLSASYWSTSEYFSNTGYVWDVNFQSGDSMHRDKVTHSHNVICVR